ncbi:MAG: hypothetical protein H7Z42_01085 [Roseiflexaceae bacterium]|nr:hypothetical protein [Roseiflexaceae bacterium]
MFRFLVQSTKKRNKKDSFSLLPQAKAANCVSPKSKNQEEQRMGGDELLFIGSMVWPHLPFYIIWIIGIGIAAVNYRKQKQTALLAGSAFALMLVIALIQLSVSVFGQLSMLRGGVTAQQLGGLFAASNLIAIPFNIIAWGLLLFALFARPKSNSVQDPAR